MAEGLRAPKDIIEFVTGDDYLGDKSLSVAQIAVLKGLYGLEMTADELAAFKAMHEGLPPRKGGYDEASFGFGRRSGKGEKISSAIGVYESVTFNPQFLAPGETAYTIAIAQNEKQARILRDYMEAKFRILEDKGYTIFESLSAQQKSVTAEVIRLSNRVHVACFPCKKVSVRGLTSICVLPDEYGHWQLAEGAFNADIEIFRALRPTRATMRSRGLKVPMVSTSTPFDEIGMMYDHFKNRHKTRMLVLHQVPTQYLNPTISKDFLEEERIADPDSFEREYFAKWGSGTQAKLFTREMVDGCTDKGREAEPPVKAARHVAHIDAAFKHDFFPLCIGRLDGETVVASFLKVWKPQSGRPLDDDQMAEEISVYLRAYDVDSVIGDQFCDIPLRNAFAKHGIGFMERPVNEENKYLEFKNLVSVMTARRLRLPDMDDIPRDLCGLRRKGKKIAAPHRANRHDDVSSVLRRVVYDLLPMINRVDLQAMNAGAVNDVDRLFRERGFKPPEREDSLPTDFMNERF